MTETFPVSPCIGICRMDDDRRYCVGCGRTLEEIAGWSAMSAGQRRAVLSRLDSRPRDGDSPGRGDESA